MTKPTYKPLFTVTAGTDEPPEELEMGDFSTTRFVGLLKKLGVVGNVKTSKPAEPESYPFNLRALQGRLHVEDQRSGSRPSKSRNFSDLVKATQRVAPPKENAAAAAGAQIGEVHNWKTGPHKKVAPGEWVPVSESRQSRVERVRQERDRRVRDIKQQHRYDPGFEHFDEELSGRGPKPPPPGSVTPASEWRGRRGRPQRVTAPDHEFGNDLDKRNDDGTVTLYHRTTAEGARDILSSGAFQSKENTGDAYFSTRNTGGTTGGYGDHVVAVDIDPGFVSIDDEFSDGEAHVTISPRNQQRMGNMRVEGTSTDLGDEDPISGMKSLMQQFPDWQGDDDDWEEASQPMREALDDAFTEFELPGGLAVEVQGVEDDGIGGYEIRGEFKDEYGSAEGWFMRNINYDPYTKKMQVSHDELFISEEHKGRGVGSAFLKQSFDLYEKLGVDRLKTSPADDGSYVWARFGFTWADGSGPDNVTENLKDFVILPLAEDIRDEAERQGDRVSLSEAIEIATDNSHPYDLARLHVGNLNVGKEFLHSYGGQEVWAQMGRAKMEIPSLEHSRMREYLDNRFAEMAKAQSPTENVKTYRSMTLAEDLLEDAEKFSEPLDVLKLRAKKARRFSSLVKAVYAKPPEKNAESADAAQIGEIHVWKTGPHKKVAPGKWVRVSDKHARAAALATPRIPETWEMFKRESKAHRAKSKPTGPSRLPGGASWYKQFGFRENPGWDGKFLDTHENDPERYNKEGVLRASKHMLELRSRRLQGDFPKEIVEAAALFALTSTRTSAAMHEKTWPKIDAWLAEGSGDIAELKEIMRPLGNYNGRATAQERNMESLDKIHEIMMKHPKDGKAARDALTKDKLFHGISNAKISFILEMCGYSGVGCIDARVIKHLTGLTGPAASKVTSKLSSNQKLYDHFEAALNRSASYKESDPEPIRTGMAQWRMWDAEGGSDTDHHVFWKSIARITDSPSFEKSTKALTPKEKRMFTTAAAAYSFAKFGGCGPKSIDVLPVILANAE